MRHAGLNMRDKPLWRLEYYMSAIQLHLSMYDMDSTALTEKDAIRFSALAIIERGYDVQAFLYPDLLLFWFTDFDLFMFCA